MVLSSLFLASHLAQVLQPKMRPNAVCAYKISSVERDFEGATEKVSKTIVQGMPVQIEALRVVGGKTSVSVVTGPLVVRGRSVGRSKTNTFDVDATNSWNGNPYALVGVVFPAAGAKPGQSWTAKFRGSPPLTAGLTATYKLTKITTQSGQKVALLSVSVQGDNSCRTRGRGQLVVGTDGIVRSGKLHFDIAFMRLGKGKTMVVNSHDGLDYTITP